MGTGWSVGVAFVVILVLVAVSSAIPDNGIFSLAFFGVIGYVLYLIVKPEKKNTYSKGAYSKGLYSNRPPRGSDSKWVDDKEPW